MAKKATTATKKKPTAPKAAPASSKDEGGALQDRFNAAFAEFGTRIAQKIASLIRLLSARIAGVQKTAEDAAAASAANATSVAAHEARLSALEAGASFNPAAAAAAGIFSFEQELEEMEKELT